VWAYRSTEPNVADSIIVRIALVAGGHDMLQPKIAQDMCVRVCVRVHHVDLMNHPHRTAQPSLA